jgi:hypothetical protein
MVNTDYEVKILNDLLPNCPVAESLLKRGRRQSKIDQNVKDSVEITFDPP